MFTLATHIYSHNITCRYFIHYLEDPLVVLKIVNPYIHSLLTQRRPIDGSLSIKVTLVYAKRPRPPTHLPATVFSSQPY
jgi:hypothetical protein